MTQLLVTIEKWTEMLDNAEPLDVIYLDFKKAFDTVPHHRLGLKLKAYGISGQLHTWIKDFLSERKQRVIINGKPSQYAEVTSGIPQGSVLGPILFVIFINDLPEVISTTAKIFADDTKLFHSTKTPEQQQQLQNDLNNLVHWSEEWQLHFNDTKCKVMHLGNKNQQAKYQMRGTTLEAVSQEKDLGVTVDDKLLFHQHVAAAANKASRMLYLIKSTFTCLDQSTVPLLYKSLVRPHLEYGNVIWSPHTKKDQLEIEKVQRRATRMIPSLRGLTYEERLRRLHLPSLCHRRRRGDMIQVYKIINGLDRLETSTFFELQTTSTTRGHSQKFYKRKCRLDIRKYSFSYRIVNDWNSLPTTAIESKTLNTFKTHLDRFWKQERYRLP